nr:uncharacterized mitochondrial protein AtMg00810-like [Tanacetum cinerariifolium]
MDQTNQTVHMIMPSKDNLYNGRKGIGFENPRYFEKAKDLRPTLYDEKVIGLVYTPMFLTYSDEALEIEKFKRSRENKFEFSYDYGNLNASYVNKNINFEDDYFKRIINSDFEKIDSPFQQTSSLKPYVPNVILEKIIIDLEDEVVNLLEKEKVNLETTESLKSKSFESSEKNVEIKLKRKKRKRNSSNQNVKQVDNDVSRANSDFVHFSDLDTFSSVRRPTNSGVIWKKKGSSNTSNVDEASEVIISFIKKTQVNLQLQVQRVRTDNGTEFKNKTLAKFFDEVEEASKNDLEDLFQDFYDEYFDYSKIMKTSTTNVETPINEEVFHEVYESFQGESSLSSLNDDVQQSPEELVTLNKKGLIMMRRLLLLLELKLYACSWHMVLIRISQSFRCMIRSLMYVTSSRPDIMFATCICARYQANPNEHHVSAVKRIFCYLKGTINLGLWYSKDSGFDLTAYSDADHAGCHLDRKSTSASVQFLGDKLVCWSSKKQNCVSISTTESKFVAVFGCCAQVLWMRTQLMDYGFFYDKVSIYCDSKSAIAISCNL